MLQLDSISDFNLMSFPINMCSHNKDDVLSWEVVFHHVRGEVYIYIATLSQLSNYQHNKDTVNIRLFFFFFFFLNDFWTCLKMKYHLPLVVSMYVWVMGTFQLILNE